MEQKKLKSIIEAVLFTLGSAVEIKKLAEVAEVSVEEVNKAAAELEKKYEKEESGVMLIHLEDSLQLCTKTELYDYLVKVANAPRTYHLSDSVLETLSIVAYKQPVTRLQIEHIRGVSSSHAVDKLLEYNLIQELGRLDAPGRPILFGTTEEFLRVFGVQSLEELPRLNPEKVEDFREQAEFEALSESVDENKDEGSSENPIPVGI
ncbi:MAG: SMC-Scp complex subunit ScpB [Lachnospiraceae bacterium]|nr:SMC-Scp complex subunit ScpB [Lachnospiraceae bacterium]SKB62726.1 segregation and condensation protein B [Lachnospiraceae bacterium]